jgi:hypothetical protein
MLRRIQRQKQGTQVNMEHCRHATFLEVYSESTSEVCNLNACVHKPAVYTERRNPKNKKNICLGFLDFYF